MKKIREKGALIVTLLICVLLVGGSVFAQDGVYNRSSNIASKGVIEYANNAVVIDSSDLTFLAEQIDGLEYEYKTNIEDALNTIGVEMDVDGSYNVGQNIHARTIIEEPEYEENIIYADSNVGTGLSFYNLYLATLNSQNIGEDGADIEGKSLEELEELGMDVAWATEDEDSGPNGPLGTADPSSISGITAANLTAGSAGFIDGELIIGTGADNKTYYNVGYADGYADHLPSGAHIEYIKHEHTGNSSQYGGCYTSEVKHYGTNYDVYVGHINYDQWCEDDGYQNICFIYCKGCGAFVHTCYEGQFSTSKYPHKNCPKVPMPSTWAAGCGYNEGQIIGATILWD